MKKDFKFSKYKHPQKQKDSNPNTKQKKKSKRDPCKEVKTTLEHINITQQINLPQYDFQQISKSMNLFQNNHNFNTKKQHAKKDRPQTQNPKMYSNNNNPSFQMSSAQIVRKINMMRMQYEQKQYQNKKKVKKKSPYIKKSTKSKEKQRKSFHSFNNFEPKIIIPVDKINLSQNVRYFDQSSSQRRYNFIIRQKNNNYVPTQLEDFISVDQITKYQQQKQKNKNLSNLVQPQAYQTYEDTLMLLAKHYPYLQQSKQYASESFQESFETISKNSQIKKNIKSQSYPFRNKKPLKKQFAIQTEQSPSLKNTVQEKQISNYKSNSINKIKKSLQKIKKTQKIKTQQSLKWQQFGEIVKDQIKNPSNQIDFLTKLEELVLQNVNQLQDQIFEQSQKYKYAIRPLIQQFRNQQKDKLTNKNSISIIDEQKQQNNKNKAKKQQQDEQYQVPQNFNSKKYLDYLQGQIESYTNYQQQQDENESLQINQYIHLQRNNNKKYFDLPYQFQNENKNQSQNSNQESYNIKQQHLNIIKNRKKFDINPLANLHLLKTTSQQEKTYGNQYSQEFSDQDNRFVIKTNNDKLISIPKQQTFFDCQHQNFKQTNQQHLNQQQKDQQIPLMSRQKPKLQKQKQNIQNYYRDFNANYSSQEDSSNDSTQLKIGIQRMEKVSVMIYNGLLFEAFKQLVKKKNVINKFKQASIYITKKKQKLLQVKNGFNTNLSQIKAFIQQLAQNLLLNYKHILKKLQKSRGPTGIQILRYMHQADNYSESQDDQDIIVIPNQIFDLYWQKKQKKISQSFSILEGNEDISKLQYYKYLSQVFYRSLFDCFNQCLQLQRNFGQFGQNFPWKTAPSFNHQLNDQQLKIRVQHAKQKLFQIGATYCGIIVDRKDMKQLGQSEGYIQQVKQDRLIKMLKKDIIDEDSRWMFYDDEQVEVLVQIAHMITLDLIDESSRQIIEILQ